MVKIVILSGKEYVIDSSFSEKEKNSQYFFIIEINWDLSWIYFDTSFWESKSSIFME